MSEITKQTAAEGEARRLNLEFDTKEVYDLLLNIRDKARKKAKSIWGEEAHYLSLEELEHIIDAALLRLVTEKDNGDK